MSIFAQMSATQFHERIIDSKDWATALFVVAFALIALTKAAFENRFHDFVNLFFSDKYLKIYKDNAHLMSWFSILLFIAHLISFGFFIQLILNYCGFIDKNNGVIFIRIITFLLVFILGKYCVEKIIATAFNIEEFSDQFNLQKFSYRTYIGILLLPFNIVFFYNDFLTINVFYFIILIILIINTLTYLKTLKIYQNLIISKLFYFILYLCALEIAPYYFLYYWFAKN